MVHLPSLGCVLCQGPSHERLCPACASGSSPLDACVAELAFVGDAAVWIRRFKYARPGFAGLDPAAGAVAACWIRAAARRLPSLPAPRLLVPVPLHPRRLRRRGFHPAGELARVLGRARRVRVDPTALARLRDTPSQTGLDRRERRDNVRGAFQARRGLVLPRCVGLVDDVVTTGSTLAEAARELRRAGARRVLAVCLARTPAAFERWRSAAPARCEPSGRAGSDDQGMPRHLLGDPELEQAEKGRG